VCGTNTQPHPITSRAGSLWASYSGKRGLFFIHFFSFFPFLYLAKADYNPY
jgi:hypothetical protein